MKQKTETKIIVVEENALRSALMFLLQEMNDEQLQEIDERIDEIINN